MIKLGILTSSRADYGIYLPLLKQLKKEKDISFSLIVFGTHLSEQFGYTVKNILNDGFEVKYRIVSMLQTDDPESISTAYALTCMKFASFWKDHSNEFDLILCLGDRYEMAAAVNAGIPFGVKFAHLYGGETTVGAIDNIYRHQISLVTQLHFVSLQEYADKVKNIVGEKALCYVIGSLSLQNLKQLKLFSKQEFKKIWGIDLNLPTILVTVHPETIGYEKNQLFSQEFYLALSELLKKYQIVVTMPNADTEGRNFRSMYNLLKTNPHNMQLYLIDNLGTKSYFTCMKYCDFLLGNTSSGIIEAASFGKYVINLGNRQKGRIAGENVLNCEFDSPKILEMVKQVTGKTYTGENIYYQENSIQIIISSIRSFVYNMEKE